LAFIFIFVLWAVFRIESHLFIKPFLEFISWELHLFAFDWLSSLFFLEMEISVLFLIICNTKIYLFHHRQQAQILGEQVEAVAFVLLLS